MATAGRNTGAAKKVRSKEKKNVVSGHAHIKSTFNNTDHLDHRSRPVR